jgi:hypothetical protein
MSHANTGEHSSVSSSVPVKEILQLADTKDGRHSIADGCQQIVAPHQRETADKRQAHNADFIGPNVGEPTEEAMRKPWDTVAGDPVGVIRGFLRRARPRNAGLTRKPQGTTLRR